jgi:hypothetical protein
MPSYSRHTNLEDVNKKKKKRKGRNEKNSGKVHFTVCERHA